MVNVRNAKSAVIQNFVSTHTRAMDLYSSIVTHGYTKNGNQTRRLTNPDRRDAAQFIFFELAAAFENFALLAFQIEVRFRLSVSPMRATYVMGSLDKALTGVMGWGCPSILQSRGRNLFGKTGFFGRLEDNLGAPTYQLLTHAHKIRNRVAHSGGKAIDDYVSILQHLHVPVGERSGLSVGRLLIDYPGGTLATDRWFHRIADAYNTFRATFQASEPAVS